FDGNGSVLPEPKLTLPLVFTHTEVKVAPSTFVENPSHNRFRVPSLRLEKSGPRSVAAGSVDPAGDSVADTVYPLASSSVGMNRSLRPTRSNGFTPAVLHASVNGKTKSPVLVALSACTLFPSVAGPLLQPSGEAMGLPKKRRRVAGDASGLFGNTSAEEST